MEDSNKYLEKIAGPLASEVRTGLSRIPSDIRHSIENKLSRLPSEVKRDILTSAKYSAGEYSRQRQVVDKVLLASNRISQKMVH